MCPASRAPPGVLSCHTPTSSQCPNGKDCKYRHALPPGYVLKSQMKELLELEAASVSLASAPVWPAVGAACAHAAATLRRAACLQPPCRPLLLTTRLLRLLCLAVLQKQSVEEAIEEERAKVEAKTPVTMEVGWVAWC